MVFAITVGDGEADTSAIPRRGGDGHGGPSRALRGHPSPHEQGSDAQYPESGPAPARADRPGAHSPTIRRRQCQHERAHLAPLVPLDRARWVRVIATPSDSSAYVRLDVVWFRS